MAEDNLDNGSNDARGQPLYRNATDMVEDAKPDPRSISYLEVPRLICPFYKRDPAKYGTSRTCVGPGYSTVARIKYVRAFATTPSHPHLVPRP